MTHRMASMVVLVGGMAFLSNGLASAQVSGSGTPGTVPVWTGDGTMLTDSHVQDNGTTVNMSLPLQVTLGSGPALLGSGGNGVGVVGFSSNGNGVFGSTGGTQAGVQGNG